MVCGEALRSRRWQRKSAIAFSIIVRVAIFDCRFEIEIVLSRLRSWMMLLINRPEPVEREMRVHLGGRDVGMPEDRLHRAQVRAVFDHVSGAGMPQHVRRRMPS